MKKLLYTLLVGGIGSALFLILLGGVFYRLNFFKLAEIISIWAPSKTIVHEVEKEIITVSSEELIRQGVQAAEQSLISVKAYRQGALLRFGTGIILTQDGLIITVTQAVPPEADTYQALLDNQIWRAEVVFRDQLRNLALLKVTASVFKPANFNCPDFLAGDTLYIAGKLSLLNTAETFVQKAFISRRWNFDRIMIEGNYRDYLNGAGLISAEGAFCGLVYIDGRQILAWQSDIIKKIIDDYLP